MNIIKFIIKAVTWPFLFIFFLFVCVIWLISGAWDSVDKDVDEMAGKVGYMLWHFKQRGE